MKLILGQADAAGIGFVLDHLRLSDLAEQRFMRSALGRPATFDLHAEIGRIYAQRPIHAFYRKTGEPVAILGINPTPRPDVGAIWLLGTHGFDADWRAGIRASRAFIQTHATQSHGWNLVGNVVPAHMTERLRWLEHLGFDIDPPEANPHLNGVRTFWLHAAP